MIICLYQFKATKAGLKHIDDILKSVIQVTRFKTGCVSSGIWRNQPNASSLLLIEEWESIDVLREHFNSSAFRKLLAAMELCSEKPEVKFIQSDDIGSLEWLESSILGFHKASAI